jgi:hypothetical protein
MMKSKKTKLGRDRRVNKRGVFEVGMALLIVFFILAIATFATIDPLKESLDNNRGGSTLNCPGTPTFNQTDYDDDTSFQQLVRRPTCFVTGISLIWFIFVVLLFSTAWVYNNWRKTR